MLLSFSVENYRSFKGEETLNLLACKGVHGTQGSPDWCEVPGTDEHVLRVASLYGANGAGKSNLVRAVALVRQLLLYGPQREQPIPFRPFQFDEQTPTMPTSFDLRFLEGGEIFRYGACFDAWRVHEEWLDVCHGKSDRNVFSRTTDGHGAVEVSLGPAAEDKGDSGKLKSLAKVGARPNQLFLAAVVDLDDPEAQGPRLQRAVNWFRSTLAVIKPDARFRGLASAIAMDPEFAKFASDFLREASTGIAGLKTQTRPVPRSELRADELEQLQGGELDQADGAEVFLEGPGEDAIKARRIAASHALAGGRTKAIPFTEESDGSQRLLHLLPLLHRIKAQGAVFVIDELERSMHPMLARKFIEFFRKAAQKSGSQLIFTTHETTLLDLDLMRRDGIWFAEKDPEGATHLYSLADFKVRNDLRIEKGYLQGRFGAIPFLGGIDRLIEEQAAAEAEA